MVVTISARELATVSPIGIPHERAELGQNTPLEVVHLRMRHLCGIHCVVVVLVGMGIRELRVQSTC